MVGLLGGEVRIVANSRRKAQVECDFLGRLTQGSAASLPREAALNPQDAERAITKLRAPVLLHMGHPIGEVGGLVNGGARTSICSCTAPVWRIGHWFEACEAALAFADSLQQRQLPCQVENGRDQASTTEAYYATD
jgi:hypothetical protein